jgi:hypothetical protein
MDDKQLNAMLEQWAKHAQEAAPRLRPTPGEYAALRARRPRISWYPALARWAAVGAAAAAIVTVVALHPGLVPRQLFQEQTAPEHRDDALTSDALTSDALTSDALTSDALTSDALTSDALTSDALTSDAPVSGAKAEDTLTNDTPIAQKAAEPAPLPAEIARAREPRPGAPAPSSPRYDFRSPEPLDADGEQGEAPVFARAAPMEESAPVAETRRAAPAREESVSPTGFTSMSDSLAAPAEKSSAAKPSAYRQTSG